VARYYSLKIDQLTQSRPPLGPLTALQPMRGDRAYAVYRAQDKIISPSRRLLMAFGLRGTYNGTGANNGWAVPSTDPDAATNTHPDRDTYRTAADGRFNITPGCFARAWIRYVPSGQTQEFIGSGDYDPDGALGVVRMSMTWGDADGNTETDDYELTLDASQLQYAGSPSNDGGSWNAVRRIRGPLMYPDGILTSQATARKWSRPPIWGQCQIQYRGGCRVISAVICEYPWEFTIEADDPADEWVLHNYGTGVNPRYPVELVTPGTDGDPRRGSHHTLDVHHAQAQRLGPQLFHWAAYSEGTVDVTASDGRDAQSTTSATFVNLMDSNLTEWDADYPGWAISCGGYARNRDLNGDRIVLRNQDASVPVRVWVRYTSGAAGAVLRLQTEFFSMVDVDLPNDTDAWTTQVGHLRCGINPEDPSNCQALFRSKASGEGTSIYAVCLEYLEEYEETVA